MKGKMIDRIEKALDQPGMCGNVKEKLFPHPSNVKVLFDLQIVSDNPFMTQAKAKNEVNKIANFWENVKVLNLKES